MAGPVWRPWSVSTFLEDALVWKQRRWARALCVGKAEACPRHEQNAAEERYFMLFLRSAVDSL